MNNLIDLSILKTKKESFLDKNGAIITKEEIISPYLEEIKRLNNIINKLDKYIDNEIEKLEKKISQATKEEDTFGYSCALEKYHIEQKLDVLYDISIELGKFERAKR